MGPFFKKELLQLKDDRMAFALMILMPLVLIAILGFALADDFRGAPDHIRIAVVDEDAKETALSQLEERLKDELPGGAVTQLMAMAPDVSAPDLLIEEVLQDGALSESIELEFASDVAAARDNKDYSAVIRIPNGYRLYMWEHMFLGHSDGDVALSLYTNKEESMRASIVESLIDHFYYEMQLQTVLNRRDAVHLRETLTPERAVVHRGVKPITSFEYYTIGMSVMFVLFAAGITAGYAVQEKRTHVFARLLLANTSRGKYLISRWATTAIVAFLQLLLLFVVTSLAFDVEWQNWTATLLVTLALCIAVGGIGALLTAVNFNLNSDKASSVFQIFLISVMAFVGGSMVPVKEISPLLGRIGDLTPNGRALTGYLQIMQGRGVTEIVDTLVVLCCFGSGCFILAVILFPRKGALS